MENPEDTASRIHAIVVGLHESELLLRHVFDKKAIKEIMKNNPLNIAGYATFF